VPLLHQAQSVPISCIFEILIDLWQVSKGQEIVDYRKEFFHQFYLLYSLDTLYSMVYTDNDDNITDTRLKLEEETYFLDQARTNQNRWKFYNFYINAFFSSAYNVPEVMQKEFEKKLKDPEEFYKWSKQLKQNLNNQFPTNFLIYHKP
jgi:hypothetical protein